MYHQSTLVPVVARRRNGARAVPLVAVRLLRPLVESMPPPLAFSQYWRSDQKYLWPRRPRRKSAEARIIKEGRDDASKSWGPYAVRNHTVRHPILGNMTIPVITSDPETSSKKSNGCTTGIEFRKSLGINEAEVSFPSTGDAAQSKRKSSGRRSSKSKYRLGYGLRVPLFALALPISDPVETAAEALHIPEQDHVITKKSTDNQAPCDGFSGMDPFKSYPEGGQPSGNCTTSTSQRLVWFALDSMSGDLMWRRNGLPSLHQKMMKKRTTNVSVS